MLSEARASALDIDACLEGREPVPETPVDPAFGGPQDGERLAALVDRFELGAHHGGQGSASPTGGGGPHPGGFPGGGAPPPPASAQGGKGPPGRPFGPADS